MAAELVETTRVLARTVAAIQPGWVETAAGDLAVRTHGEPQWDARRGQVSAVERVSVHGLPVVTGRSVDYARIDPAAARDLFLRHALIGGEWQSPHAFVAHNRRVLEEATRIEERTRRRTTVVTDEQLLSFFGDRIPPDVHDGRTFDRWWRGVRGERPDLLTLDLDTVLRRGPDPDPEGFPHRWDDPATSASFPLTYRFAPGEPDDGVTVDVPLSQLPGVDLDALGWLVPGLREELVAELIRTLPKALRRSFAPAATHAAAVLEALEGGGRGPLLEQVARRLSALGGTVVTDHDFAPGRLAPHLRMLVRVRDADGDVVAAGRDLEALRAELAVLQRAALAELTADLERSGLRDWPDLDVPVMVQVPGPTGVVVGYPTLVEEPGGTVGLRVFATRHEADVALPRGIAALLRIRTSAPIRELVAALPTHAKLAIAAPPGTDTAGLLADVVRAATNECAARHASVRGWPRTRAGFEELAAEVSRGIRQTTKEVLDLTVRVVAAAREAQAELAAVAARTAAAAPGSDLATGLEDARTHLDALTAAGFVTRAGPPRLPHLLRYLAASRRRSTALAEDPARDAHLLHQWREAAEDVARATDRALDGAPIDPGPLGDPEIGDLDWQLEEFRVALFAQSLGTVHPVSRQRIQRAVQAATARARR
jgi:ATP-dependent helicase HrpA